MADTANPIVLDNPFSGIAASQTMCGLSENGDEAKDCFIYTGSRIGVFQFQGLGKLPTRDDLYVYITWMDGSPAFYRYMGLGTNALSLVASIVIP
jgi:hypothetical protein